MQIEIEKLVDIIKQTKEDGAKVCFLAGGGLTRNPFYEIGKESLPKNPANYWRILENLRLCSTYEEVPLEMELFAEVVKKTGLSSIITTIYDAFLDRALAAVGMPFVLNPCIERDDVAEKEDYDGYKNPTSFEAGVIKLFKMHGDVRYVRFEGCCRIQRVDPDFEQPYPEEPVLHAKCGVRESVCQHVRIPEAGNVLFREEIEHAFRQVESCENRLIVSVGFGGSVKTDKHLVRFLTGLLGKKTIVDINPSYTDLNTAKDAEGRECMHIRSKAKPVFLRILQHL